MKIAYDRPEYGYRLIDLIDQRKLTPTIQSGVKQRYDHTSEPRMSSEVFEVWREEILKKARDAEANRCRAYIGATF